MKSLKYILIIMLACSIATIISCGKKIPVIIEPEPIDSTANFPRIANSTEYYKSNISLDSIRSILKWRWQVQGVYGNAAYYKSYVEFKVNTTGIDSIKWYKDTKIFANGRANYYKYPTGNLLDSNINIKYLLLPSSPGFLNINEGNLDSLYASSGLEITYFLTKVY